MENLVKSCYIKSDKIFKNKSKMEEDIDLEDEYCLESHITEDEFRPKEKFVVVTETSQEIPETQEKDEKSIKPSSILLNVTQTQVILETQVLDDIQGTPETQTDVIVTDY